MELWNGDFVLGLGGPCYDIYVGVSRMGGGGRCGSSSRLGFGLAGGEVAVYRHDLTHSCHKHSKSFFF